MDIRKYGIVIAIAILSAILIYAIADAVAGPSTQWRDCGNYPKAIAPSQNCAAVPEDAAARAACQDAGNDYQAVYDSNGCVSSYECSTCYREQRDADQHRRAVFFYAAIALGLVAIVAGFLLPLGSVNEWVGLGFVFGGVIGLFMGTVAYWSDLSRLLRPVVIAIELAIVLFIIYRRMSSGSASASASTSTIASGGAKRKR